MGSGAPKRIDSIPIERVVTILAAEGLVDEAFRNLSSALGEVFNGGENWSEVTKWRELLFVRTKLMTQAIMGLERSQNNV